MKSQLVKAEFFLGKPHYDGDGIAAFYAKGKKTGILVGFILMFKKQRTNKSSIEPVGKKRK